MKNENALGLLLACLASSTVFASTTQQYVCRSRATGNVINLKPHFGEIDTTNRGATTLISLDGLSVQETIFETYPVKKEISFKDEDGMLIATIFENGASIRLKNYIYDKDKQMNCTRIHD